ncbi:MAG: sigma-70 family RNA polymerase sigma factor [Rhizomicrobium sp.]|jgi:RNA polymerase sigma-70 factor (ECF subfamily)
MSDSDRLAQAATNGDVAAFAELVRMHQGKLRGFLRRMTRGDPALADDLAQDTFLEAYRKIGQFRAEGAFPAWLFQIGYSRYLMHARKHKLEPLEEPFEPLRESESALHAKFDLETALAKLLPARRAALTLCFAQGYSHEEAAAIMGVPLGTLKSHVLRGREEVRTMLSAWKDAL